MFAFFMINALFVLVVFLLQLNKDNLHVKWPFGVKTNITYDETTQEVKLHRTASVLDQVAANEQPSILIHGTSGPFHHTY